MMASKVCVLEGTSARPKIGVAGQRYLKNHHQWVDVRAQQEDNFYEIISPER